MQEIDLQSEQAEKTNAEGGAKSNISKDEEPPAKK